MEFFYYFCIRMKQSICYISLLLLLLTACGGNKKAGRKGKAPESIIPTEYLTQEVQTELLEEASEAPEE